MKNKQTKWGIFRWPFLLSVTSLTGLISGLTGTGVLDVVSWVTLGGLIIVITLSAFLFST
ncbi:hypothetical protein J3L16_11315 [Alteromonas sp. 5E99-2]|uniref:hypothetical protein n=1 Tax=Alteromonas sp. 5E99-2 TaxID=2817683 RepID=UPI001A980CD5|nr:hypothetical protein [Alteromonas sp. 5E99-2]MBO1256270.1 hypothetical protein [Alteromonas sp. 5E99-2]